MSNKKFFLGVAAGLIGGVLFPKIKNELKPIAVKLTQEVLMAGEQTRKETLADEYLDVDLQQLGQKELQLSEDIMNLKEQLTEMEEKLKSTKQSS